jgi:hypothetical protein
MLLELGGQPALVQKGDKTGQSAERGDSAGRLGKFEFGVTE